MTLVSTVGGASGPLFGTFFLRFGGGLGDSDPATPAEFAIALRAGLDGVVARGKAEAGDKTMYDALAPAVDALDAALSQQNSLPTRWSRPGMPPPPVGTRPSRCKPARAGPAISASAASAIRTPAPPR